MRLELTRGQIIEQGLSLAGRPDLVSDARYWLSMFLEDMYMNQDFEWLAKRETGIVVADDTEIPEDYRAAISAILVHPNGTTSPLQVLTQTDEIEQKSLQMTATLGAPQFVYIDPIDRVFKFISQPDQAYTMNLRYYHIPEIGLVSDDTCDDDVPHWGLPASILIDHVKARAFEYNDDQRQEGADVKVDNKIMRSKMNNHDRRAGPSRIKLGKRFKKRF